jgi:hypothetical protein
MTDADQTVMIKQYDHNSVGVGSVVGRYNEWGSHTPYYMHANDAEEYNKELKHLTSLDLVEEAHKILHTWKNPIISSFFLRAELMQCNNMV